jgi:hypothetical protein
MVVIERRLSCFKMRHLAPMIIVALSLPARADILFEGYSKVMLEDKHVGYVVQRYEFDNKKKEFITAYYLKTNQLGGNITESLKARATQTLKPVSYQYTELAGDKGKTIDAQFKGEQMTATINEGGKKQVIQKKIPKGVFLSSFLAYVMLVGKDGIKSGAKYGFQAIAEEDASIYTGEAYVKGEESIGGMKAFKVLNTFKGAQFVSYCTYKGEVVATRSPVQRIATDLVAGAREATAGLPLNSNALIQLFGNVPRGVDNPLSRRTEAEAPSAEKSKTLDATPPPSTDSPKQQGVPGGKGMHLKGEPEPSTAPEGK